MNDTRNMILAIVLSAIVLFGWSALSERYFPTAAEPSTKIEDGRPVAIPTPQADPGADAPAAMRERGLVLAEAPRIAIRTPRLQGTINLRGAQIDDLVLTRHRENMTAGSPAIRLLSPAGAAGAYVAGFGWSGDGVALPGPGTVWTPSAGALTPQTPVTLRWDNGRGQRFAIRISVDDGYMFTIAQSIGNAGAGAIAARPYSIISRAEASADPDSMTMHVGPVGVFDGAADYGWDFDDIAEGGSPRFTSTGGWLGFSDKYWLTAIIPDQASRIDAGFRSGGRGGFVADYAPAAAIVAPGTVHAYTSRFFAGAKEIALLDRYQDGLGIAKFDKAIDWGWFEWFMKPIFKLLNWLFAALGNFGFAIICLTLIVRLLLFPIAQKQFASMAAMRVVQPKMKAIQERWKDDKPRQQQEMLKLYKDEKINPAAGCLPILLQIPIWYALYKVLTLAVEMRHQPFVGWLRDLAAPDPLTPVNLFGFLDFAPPAFLAIGVLPILVAVTLWLQMRLNPAPMDAVQKQIFGLMPWVLMFVMASFAAGLQLYWLTSNILTIAQQKWLYSRHPGMKEPVAGAAK